MVIVSTFSTELLHNYLILTFSIIIMYIPFDSKTFSHPTPTATLSIAPKFPGTLILSHMNCRGIGLDSLLTFSGVGVSNTPEIL